MRHCKGYFICMSGGRHQWDSRVLQPLKVEGDSSLYMETLSYVTLYYCMDKGRES